MVLVVVVESRAGVVQRRRGVVVGGRDVRAVHVQKLYQLHVTVNYATTRAALRPVPSDVFTCIGALGTPLSRTGPFARKYLPGFPFS